MGTIIQLYPTSTEPICNAPPASGRLNAADTVSTALFGMFVDLLEVDPIVTDELIAFVVDDMMETESIFATVSGCIFPSRSSSLRRSDPLQGREGTAPG
jgi:hypothetical protein